ncbi:MAG: AAA family ATPase [Pirellula sp.]|nr:AAA family ATPase [Pirellula sp.]
MSYLKHWKLQRSPFSIQGNRRAVFTGGAIEEAIARSEFLVDQRKQLGLLMGPSGVGKTTLLEHLAFKRHSQNPRESMIRVDLRSSNFPSLAGLMADALGLARGPSDSNVWGAVQDHLFSASAIGHRTIMVFDNVCEVDDDIVQTLSSLICSKMPWCTFLSVDDESLVNLPRWILEQCDLKIELPAWDLGQTADYFEFAIAREGGRDDMFDGQSMTRIHELGDGIPRKISQIAELALVAGAVRKSECVTSELVDQVCNEFTFTVGAKFPIIWEDQRLNAR